MQWEYYIEGHSMTNRWNAKKAKEEIKRFNERLNMIGAKGWELVSYEDVPLYGMMSTKLRGTAYLPFFERQK